MGILDDTLSDASRPLPSLTLRREVDDAAPEFSPEPADDAGEALTVYRLQKDGGGIPPLAPPVPRAVDASTAAVGPLHAPVGKFDDATLQFVNSIEGLETGKGQASTWNSDATDRQERLVSPDSSHRLDYGVSTGSSVFSNRVPSPFDDPGKFVHRIGSSDGMRRATGQGAPSGEPVTPAAPDTAAAAPDAGPESDRGSERQAARDMRAATDPPPPDSAATPREARLPAAATIETPPQSGPPARAARAATRIAADPVLAQATAPSPGPAPRMPSAIAAAPRLSIGRIEVTVLAPAQPVPKPAAAPADAFLSKHYLRRL